MNVKFKNRNSGATYQSAEEIQQLLTWNPPADAVQPIKVEEIKTVKRLKNKTVEVKDNVGNTTILGDYFEFEIIPEAPAKKAKKDDPAGEPKTAAEAEKTA